MRRNGAGNSGTDNFIAGTEVVFLQLWCTEANFSCENRLNSWILICVMEILKELLIVDSAFFVIFLWKLRRNWSFDTWNIEVLLCSC